MNSNRNIFDDFTAIRGIGKIRDRWLREEFNVHTYPELAELPVSKIVDRLKAEGKIISQGAIEDWIDQARALIPESAAAQQGSEQAATGALVDKINSSGHQNGWTPFASFLVYFQSRAPEGDRAAYQTLVHYMEEDRETSWPGIEARALSGWMLEQISDQVDVELLKQETDEDEQLEEKLPQTKTRPAIKIEQVRIFQPAAAKNPTHRVIAGQHFKGKLVQDQPFKCEVDFSLTGQDAKQIAGEGISCLARCYEYDTASKASALLAESGPVNLEKGKLGYTFEIPSASLPRGDYRMWVMVTTPQASRLTPDFLEMPSLTLG